MNKKILLFLLACFQFPALFACMNTYQFKIFPVGVSQDKIVTIDVQIRRASVADGSRWLNLGKTDAKNDVMWILFNHVCTYDKNQNLLSKVALDTTYSIGKSYEDTLDRAYHRGLARIATDYPELDYFRPEYISFCDFQQKCKRESILADTIANKDYIVFEGKNYPVPLLKDTSYYGFARSAYHPDAINGIAINSIRIYKSKNLSLLVTHLATGDEYAKGGIHSDVEKAGKTGVVFGRIAKEHTPEIAFTDIKKTTYAEPVLQHGYGFDLFIIP